jgi:hypothetical protein
MAVRQDPSKKIGGIRIAFAAGKCGAEGLLGAVDLAQAIVSPAKCGQSVGGGGMELGVDLGDLRCSAALRFGWRFSQAQGPQIAPSEVARVLKWQGFASNAQQPLHKPIATLGRDAGEEFNPWVRFPCVRTVESRLRSIRTRPAANSIQKSCEQTRVVFVQHSSRVRICPTLADHRSPVLLFLRFTGATTIAATIRRKTSQDRTTIRQLRIFTKSEKPKVNGRTPCLRVAELLGSGSMRVEMRIAERPASMDVRGLSAPFSIGRPGTRGADARYRDKPRTRVRIWVGDLAPFSEFTRSRLRGFRDSRCWSRVLRRRQGDRAP